MSELDRLAVCLEDAEAILALQTEDGLREYFRTSRTGIAGVFGESADQVLERWPADAERMNHVREYLLMEYIAYNISEIYARYDMVRNMVEDAVDDLKEEE